MTSIRGKIILAGLAAGLSFAPILPAQNSVRVGGQAQPPEVEAWQIVASPQSSLVFGRDGSLVGEIGRQLRTSVSLKVMPRYVQHAFIGVEAASRHYFAKSASRLSLAEAATLAALPKSPNLYDPTRFAARAKARRDLILGLMADQGYITRDAAEKARSEAVVTAPDAGMSAPAQYF